MGEVLHIGDRVRRRLGGLHSEYGEDGVLVPPIFEGVVTYIHPEGRYHVVRFDFAAGSLCESFHGLTDSYPGDSTQEPLRKPTAGQHQAKKPKSGKHYKKRK